MGKMKTEAQYYQEYLDLISYHVNPPSFWEWRKQKEQQELKELEEESKNQSKRFLAE